jgi:hypothetical protein
MIIKELFMTRSDGVKLYRTYSDEEKPLLQVETGIVYSEAIDVEHAPYTYRETEYEEVAEYREIPETIAPEEAFSFEERGWWKGELYESLFDNMTWNPEQFAAAWKNVPTDE